MTPLTRANVLIADAGPTPWAAGLARSLEPLPVTVHWSHSDLQVIEAIHAKGVHVAIVDGNMPGGGLRIVQRVRQTGWDRPCLLVCDDADPRLLQDALALNVFSVIARRPDRDVLTPMVLKVFKQVYSLDWASPSGAN